MTPKQKQMQALTDAKTALAQLKRINESLRNQISKVNPDYEMSSIEELPQGEVIPSSQLTPEQQRDQELRGAYRINYKLKKENDILEEALNSQIEAQKNKLIEALSFLTFDQVIDALDSNAHVKEALIDTLTGNESGRLIESLLENNHSEICDGIISKDLEPKTIEYLFENGYIDDSSLIKYCDLSVKSLWTNMDAFQWETFKKEVAESDLP